MNALQAVTDFVISRQVWLRGEGSIASRLLRTTDNKRCCVGIYLGACGVPDAVLAQRAAAASPGVREVTSKVAPWLLEDDHFNSRFVEQLYDTNDIRGNSDPQREADITTLFAQQGVAVTFVD